MSLMECLMLLRGCSGTHTVSDLCYADCCACPLSAWEIRLSGYRENSYPNADRTEVSLTRTCSVFKMNEPVTRLEICWNEVYYWSDLSEAVIFPCLNHYYSMRSSAHWFLITPPLSLTHLTHPQSLTVQSWLQTCPQTYISTQQVAVFFVSAHSPGSWRHH